MGNGNNELDVSATLTAHLALCYLHSASVANDAFIANALVLTAAALVILRGTENLLTEQTIALRLVGTVVDSLRLGDLTIRVLLDFLGRCKADGNLREIILYLCIFFESHVSNFSIFKH